MSNEEKKAEIFRLAAKVIIFFEGSKKNKFGQHVPYLDSAKLWTIGYGHLIVKDGKPHSTKKIEKYWFAPSIASLPAEWQLIDASRAAFLLDNHLELIWRQISQKVKTILTNPQWVAILSLVYNIGIGNFSKSRLLKLINNAELDESAIRAAFDRFCFAAGIVVAGLRRRRRIEGDLFFSDRADLSVFLR